MAHNVVAKFSGNFGLQLLYLFGAELDDLSGVHIDEVVMVLSVRVFEACTAFIKGVSLNGTFFFKQAERPVDRGQRHAAIDRMGAVIQIVCVRMIGGLCDNAQDHLSLLRHAQSVHFHVGEKPFVAFLSINHIANVIQLPRNSKSYCESLA